MRAPLAALLEKHRLSQRDVAQGTGLAVSAVSDIVNGKRAPVTSSVNKLLVFIRRYEPRVSYEDLFAPELAKGRKGAA
jgi:transcriptional regulator with XRE-family HTH domain